MDSTVSHDELSSKLRLAVLGGTNDLWQWLEFKARDLSAAQQRMRVRWKAWLDKKLGRRKEKK